MRRHTAVGRSGILAGPEAQAKVYYAAFKSLHCPALIPAWLVAFTIHSCCLPEPCYANMIILVDLTASVDGGDRCYVEWLSRQQDQAMN